MIIDIFIIGFVIFLAWRGYRKGFLTTVTMLAGWIAALVAGYFLWPEVKKFLTDSLGAGDWMTEKIGSLELMSGSGAAGDAGGSMLGILAEAGGSAADSLNQIVSASAADTCLSIASFVLVVVAVKLLVNIIAIFFRTVNRIPLLGFGNRLLGAGAGAAKAIIIIWVIGLLLVPVGAIMGDNIIFEKVSKGSLLADSCLYENNPLFNILKFTEE